MECNHQKYGSRHVKYLHSYTLCQNYNFDLKKLILEKPNRVGYFSKLLYFGNGKSRKKIPFLRNECCINNFQNSFLEFFNLLIFGQCEIFEFEDFFGIFSINWTNSKDCRYQWSLVSDKMIRLDSLTIEWPGHQLLHHQMNFVLNHDGWLSNDDYRHQREDNMSDGGLLV